jgi:hypothetical protein
MVPISRSEDRAITRLCATMAGLCGLVIALIPVVVREFLACLDILNRHNPDDTPELFSVAVGLTRMIDIRCRVLEGTPINGRALVQAEDIGVACR